MKKKLYVKLMWLSLVLFAFAWTKNMKIVEAAVTYVPVEIDDIWIAGEISVAGEVDYYVVQIPSAGWLKVDYQGLSIRDGRFQIWDCDLIKNYWSAFVGSSSAASPQTRTCTLAMEAGSYVVKIYGGYSPRVGEYRVRASFTPAGNNESTNNNTFDTAQKLSMDQMVTGFISEDDRFDFYRIDLATTKKIKLKYTSCIDETYFMLYDEDYMEMNKKYVPGGSISSPKMYTYEKTLSAGTYYVKVQQYTSGIDHGKYYLTYEEEVLVSDIGVSGNKVVVAGKDFQLKAAVYPDNATNKQVSWKSADSSIASVDSNGKITTHKAGIVNITVCAGDGSGTARIVKIVVKPKKIVKPIGYKKSTKKAYISWTAQSGVTGYQIQYSTNKNFRGTKIKKVSAGVTSATVGKLSRKKYYFRVRGYVKSGKTMYYGTWSAKKIINMK